MADNASDQFTMASFLDLLAQNQPQFQTRRALILLGLQNDFISPEIGFVDEIQPFGYLDRIKAVIPHFRETGDIIWARTEYSGDVTVNNSEDVDGERVIFRVEEKTDDFAVDSDSEQDHDDVDPLEADLDPSPPVSPAHAPPGMTRTKVLLETIKRDRSKSKSSDESTNVPTVQQDVGKEELFLDQGKRMRPFCLAGTWGAEFEDSFKPYIDERRDLQVTKPKYSAFAGTNLLLTLRTKLVTEIYLCGNLTNMSIYATAMDAARHGLAINILEDCCGFRHRPLHDESMRQMKELMGASMVVSLELYGQTDHAAEVDPVRPLKDRETIEGALEKMTLSESLPKSTSIDPAASANAAHDAEVSRPRRIRQKPIVRRSGGTRDHTAATVANTQQESGVSLPPPNRMYKKPRFRGHREDQKLKDEHAKVDARIDGAIAKLNDHLNNGAKIIEDARKVTRPIINESSPESGRTVSTDKPKDRQREPTSGTTGHDSTQDLESSSKVGEGDSYIFHDLLPLDNGSKTAADGRNEDDIFQQLYDEVRWQKMFHQQGEVPRLVAVQGEVDEDGSEPVYRHPSDQALPTMRFSPTIQRIRDHVERALKHPINHVLIQLYRSGTDYISEHSDKTLDIVRGSSIANASFGAQRTMRLRLKKSALKGKELDSHEADPTGSRPSQRIVMPHNSLFVLGPQTNARWLHGINPDKRPLGIRGEAENAYGGVRISLTFRHIGTFISIGPDSKPRIWGQGATSKSKDSAKPAISNAPSESENLIRAFGTENHGSLDFDWETTYGNGSDVLHLRNAPEENATLFLSGDHVQDLRVRMWLEELNLRYSAVETPLDTEPSVLCRKRRTVAYLEKARKQTEIEGALEILAYLRDTLDEDGNAGSTDDKVAKKGSGKSSLALDSSFLYESIDIYSLWLHYSEMQPCNSGNASGMPHPLYSALKRRDLTLSSNGFLGGSNFGIADCALWPVVREIREAVGHDGDTDDILRDFDREFPNLWAWFGRIESRGSTRRALR
ncbi:MAG: hypothetical protein M1821_007220 [Bathelium mastoideum]|nr:MAG: hypothetical protein M1821_007220 [Bathelium mastoideum]KAI9694725.1 MAG: hypothetical protein M1822_000341 [Bathelium mastoideum]